MTKTRFSACVAEVVGTALLAAGSATAAASEQASCNGIAVSSAAGQPGAVSTIVRQIHQEFKDGGLPPGAGDSAFAKLHQGSLEGCLGAFPG